MFLWLLALLEVEAWIGILSKKIDNEVDIRQGAAYSGCDIKHPIFDSFHKISGE